MIRRVVKSSAIALGAVFILLSIFFAALQTSVVRQKIQGMTIAYAKQNGLDLSIDSIEGALPVSWTVHNVQLTWGKENSLKIKRARIRFDFFAIFRRAFSIDSLTLDDVELKHAETPEELKLERVLAACTSLPWNIRIKHLKAPHFKFEDLNSRKRAVFTVRTSIWLKKRGKAFAMRLKANELFPHGNALELSAKGARKQVPNQVSGDLNLKLESLKLDSTLANLQVKDLVFANHTFEGGEVEFQFPDLKRISPLLTGSFHGYANLGQLTFKSKLGSEDLKIKDQPFPFFMSISALQDEGRWKGWIQLQTDQAALPINGRAAVQFDPKRGLNFDEISLTGPESALSGHLKVNVYPLMLEGELYANALDLSRFKLFLPKMDLGGSLGIDIKLSALRDEQRGRPNQQLQAHILSRNVRLDDYFAQDLLVQTKLSHLFDHLEGSLSLDGEQMRHKGALLSSLAFNARCEDGKGSFDLSMLGNWNEDIDLRAEGDWARENGGLLLHIAQLSGYMQKNAFFLQQPFSWGIYPEQFTIQDLRMHAGHGTLAADAKLSKSECEIRLQAEHFPLELVALPNFLFKGTTSFDGYLFATSDKIEGRGSLVFEEATVLQQGKKDPFLAKGTVLAHISPNILQINAQVKAKGGQLLEWSASLPLEYQLFPFELRLNQTAPIASELIAEGNLEELFDFVNTHSHRASGLISAHLFLSHTLKEPKLLGTLELHHGRYENYFIGTDMREIEAKAYADGRAIFLNSFDAKDDDNGTLNARGMIELNPAKRFPYFFEGEVHDCHFIGISTLSAKFSGPAEVSGDFDGALIKGSVTTTQADLNIPEKLPIEPPVLPITFINEPANLTTFHLPRAFPLKLDLTVSTPGKVYIKGKGLDSEWKGTVRLTGTNMNLNAAGTLTLVKGDYLFGGKVFTLTQGEVTFTDKANLSSYINLTGTLQVQDTTIFAHLRGPLLAPNLTFESLPHMPTSSLLSIILFNKDISEISPFQAIQIAQTIVSMSGGAGPNVLEAIRKSLGVDRLNITSAQDGSDAISVQIGKYLTRGVMVTLVQGTSSSQVQVEVDLKNGFVLMAETQEEEEGKFTLKWNKNY